MLIAFLAFWFLLYSGGTWIENDRVKRGRWPDRGDRMSTTGLLGTLLHATIAILVGLPIILSDMNLNDKNTWAQSTFLLFSIAWFAVDTIWIVYERNWKIDFILHHIICLIGLWNIYSIGYYGWVTTAAISIGEMGPCFYIEILAKRWKYGSTRFYFINDTAYVISFSITRFILYTALTLILLLGDPPLLVKIPVIGLLAISYYWAVLLIRKYWTRWHARSSDS